PGPPSGGLRRDASDLPLPLWRELAERPPEIRESAPRPRRPRDRLPRPPAEHLVGRGRIDPLRAQVAVRQAARGIAPEFPPVAGTLSGAGLPVDVFQSVILHPADYISLVLSDPVRYGAWAQDMQPQNAEYVFLTHLLARQLDLAGVVSLYHSIRDVTGWDIGYFAVDSRLFPISVQNTGIFYAPVKLSDHRILQLPDGRILPIEFFQIFATTNRASNIPIQ